MRYSRFFLVLFLLASGSFFTAAQNLTINEIMASNSATNADEDGEYSDWIELFNGGGQTISLTGWGLSDSRSNPYKWVFPEVSLEPGRHLLVWASGKDRKPARGLKVNGLTLEIFSGISGTSLSSLVQHASYPANPSSRQLVKTRFEAPVNQADNYGQKLHGFLRAPATGSYIFWLASDDNGQLWISSGESMENLRLIASVPAWTYSREWTKYAEQQSAEIFLEEGKFYYIMALSKEGSGGDNLAVGWKLPDGTIDRPVSGQHLFRTEGELHTNFSISAEGEEILLTHPQGNITDQWAPVAIPTDISYGRSPDGNSTLRFFKESTPGRANSSAGYSEVLKPPVFSHTGGFYGSNFTLALSTSQPGASIVLTIDGSLPSAQNLSGTSYQYKNQYRQSPGSSSGPFLERSYRSYQYTVPIQIKDRSAETNQVSRISTTYDSNPYYMPVANVDKAVVVKAMAVMNGALPSEVVSHTYFVKPGGINPYPLPVISLSAQENHLFDYYKGIYVAGVDFENWRTANPSLGADGGRPANYHRDGDEWEYPAHFELFENSGRRALGQNIGVRIHGGWSRAHPYKSLRIYARNEYGVSHLNYPFFNDQDYDSYKRIILRNSGNDNYYTLFRDAAIHEMVKHMNFETMAFQPSILFLNGEYWGLHNIRERYDKFYLARKFEINEDQVDILEWNAVPDEGDNNHYTETIDYITQNGLQDTKNYDHITTRIDVSSYIDYMLTQIFIVNTDWPGNNIKYWRLKTDEYLPWEKSGRDGRWRWMLFDTDFGFGIYNPNEYTKDMMAFATATNGPDWPNPPWSTFLFRKFLENEDFRIAFVTRFCDQLNTAFRPEIVKSVIDNIYALLQPEMTRQIQRWKIPSSLNAWNNNVNVMRTFAENRPLYARNHLRQFFTFEGDYQLTADVSDPSEGYIVVNTIPLLKETRGVPVNPYPWQGTYFRKVPLRLEARPQPGFEFVRWESGGNTFPDPVLTLQPDANLSVRAVFRKSEKVETLVHYWNFNDPLKLLNVSFTRLTAGLRPQAGQGSTPETVSDDGQSFSAINARFNDLALNHLRVNNPLGSQLVFELPTTGYSDIKIRYETRRSGQGAGIQVIEYTMNGSDYLLFSKITVKDEVPSLVLLDFSGIKDAGNNPLFKLRISFEKGDGGTAGNNRFDNFTVEGISTGTTDISTSVAEVRGPGMLIYPNPIGNEAVIDLFLPRDGHVSVGLYSITGTKLSVIYNGFQSSGTWGYMLNGAELKPGTYIIIAQTPLGILREKILKM